jgi:uncharacterized iron-regulated membrane protein
VIRRLLNIQGIVGTVVSLSLAMLLAIQTAETSHWKKQSGRFEQLYAQEQAAFSTTVANYRAASDQARAADKANAERVAAEQGAINQRSTNDFEARLAAARAHAERLRLRPAAAADSGAGTGTPVSRIPTSTGGSAQTPGQDGLPPSDALTATEQAIQLDELIKWVKAQASVEPNATSSR